MKMAKIGLPKGSGKQLKVSEKSGNFEMDIEWQPCLKPLIWLQSFKTLNLAEKPLITFILIKPLKFARPV